MVSSPVLIPFRCTACDAQVRLPAQYLGRAILCPKCNAPQRVVDASAPVQPMDTTRALRADEVPERPVGVLSGVMPPVERPLRSFPTPLPSDVVPEERRDPDFDPLTAPAAKRVPDAALTAPASRRVSSTDSTFQLPSAVPPAPVVTVVAPQSRSVYVALAVVGIVAVGLAVSVMVLIRQVDAERDRRREAEHRAEVAQVSLAAAIQQREAAEARLTELVRGLARPAAKP